MLRRNKRTGLVVFWVKLRMRGYSRGISGLYKVLRRIGAVRRPPPPKGRYVPKPYEQVQYPDQKVQIDVKFVPQSCLVSEPSGKKFYQYTAIDEYSPLRYVEAFDASSTYTAAVFLVHMLKSFNFKVEWVQTDNGGEFTNRFGPNKNKLTLFEKTLSRFGIKYKRIKPYTPCHNGKVERYHRRDNGNFYGSHKFYSLRDFAKQLAAYNRRYNNFPMRPLGWKSPREVLALSLLRLSVTYV